MDREALKLWAGKQGESAQETNRHLAQSVVSDDGTMKHPFQVTDREAFLAQLEGKNLASRTHSAPVVSIPMSELHASQKRVNRERLSGYVSGQIKRSNGQKASGSGALIDLPIVVKVGGKYTCRDGHHRLTAAWLRGEREARVRLVDLDESEKVSADG